METLIKGFWRSHCWQASKKGYDFILTPGYSQSKCDCMICNTLWDNFGPFMASKNDLLKLDTNLNPELMFMDLFIKTNKNGHNILSCPDLMFHIDKDRPTPSRQEWEIFSKKYQIHAISIEIGPLKVHEFSCKEIGLFCDAENQAKYYLVPWCCIEAAHHIIKVLDEASSKIGFHYELDSGTLFGKAI